MSEATGQRDTFERQQVWENATKWALEILADLNTPEKTSGELQNVYIRD